MPQTSNEFLTMERGQQQKCVSLSSSSLRGAAFVELAVVLSVLVGLLVGFFSVYTSIEGNRRVVEDGARIRYESFGKYKPTQVLSGDPFYSADPIYSSANFKLLARLGAAEAGTAARPGEEFIRFTAKVNCSKDAGGNITRTDSRFDNTNDRYYVYTNTGALTSVVDATVPPSAAKLSAVYQKGRQLVLDDSFATRFVVLPGPKIGETTSCENLCPSAPANDPTCVLDYSISAVWSLSKNRIEQILISSPFVSSTYTGYGYSSSYSSGGAY